MLFTAAANLIDKYFSRKMLTMIFFKQPVSFFYIYYYALIKLADPYLNSKFKRSKLIIFFIYLLYIF